MQDYQAAINELINMDMIYPCFCSRSEIKAEIMRAGNAPHEEDYSIYPGTCRRLSLEDRESKIDQNLSYAWRLNIRAASKKLGNLTWEDIRLGKQTVPVGIIGDVVLARKDIPTSYHLSATLDDHIQRIGLVTRGEDLVSATHIHKIIQVLLGLNSPKYFHHPLILDSNGVRLSKRTRAQTVKSLKASGLKREDVIDLLGKENILYTQRNTQEEGSIPRRLVARSCIEALNTTTAKGKIIEITSSEENNALTMQKAIESFNTIINN